MTALNEKEQRRPTLKIVGIVLVVLGLALAAFSVTMAVVKAGPDLARGLTGDEYPTPVDVSVDLNAGTYVVLERGFTPTIQPSQVTVTGPDGDQLATGRPSGTQTIDRNGSHFTGAVSFRTPESGTYRVRVESGAPTSVLISRDFGSLALALLVWLVGAGLGLFLFAGGVAALIVAAVRGKRRAVPTVAAGWYPDPQYPGRQRWWNGHRWVP